MKKKYVLAGATCIFLVISGICYSCAYYGNASSPILTSDLSEEGKPEEPRKNIQKVDASANENIILMEASNYELNSGNNVNKEKSVNETTEHPFMQSSSIYVHVCGAVVKPGVYQATSGARVIDLIELAGGLQKEAASDYVNQAQQVNDGQKIYIPTQEEIKNTSVEQLITEGLSSTNEVDQSTQRININTATAEILMELPGIGEAKAAVIINYRTKNGSFSVVEDMMKIPGIKEGLFSKIADYITVK